MTTLVTGATGFVGSAVARALLERGEAVRLLTRPGSDRRNIAGLDAEVVEGDLTDRASLSRAVRGAASLYHVAADYRFWAKDPRQLYQTNVDGSRSLIQAAAEAGVARIVYTSSVATLGLPKDGSPGTEDTPVAERDMVGDYKRSKYLAEAAVAALTQARGLPVVTVNPAAPVGPRDIKPTPTGKMVLDAAAGRMGAYVDTGLCIVDVADVAQGHLLAHDRGQAGERYILGGDNLALKDILGLIAGLAGRRPPRIKLPLAPLVPIAHGLEAVARVTGTTPPVTVDELRMARKRMFFSSAKAEAALGYRHRPAQEALARAIAWYRDQGRLR